MRLNISKTKEEKQFDDIYFRYHESIYRNIRKLIYDEDKALDILQEVFVTLWNHREEKLNDANLGAWLFTVSYNQSVDFLRKKLKEEITEAENFLYIPSNYDENMEFEQQYSLKLELIEEAIEKLSPRRKEVFRLCRFEGYSKDEVAKKLKISSDSVSDYLNQSNHFIREYIKKEYPSFLSLFACVCMQNFF
ncbi:RNA polymerase sigma factor [Vaginella massiliensis]|uniref:RNA polymerase sigma factor n=1 Tax=Vaginella massiliensis TaxID=1816680 RepID=UPI00083829F9|nr:sigma-70 family RNA polymerase sigma factor [Vaginella massiliensis]